VPVGTERSCPSMVTATVAVSAGASAVVVT
jgi:hypothetical protein